MLARLRARFAERIEPTAAVVSEEGRRRARYTAVSLGVLVPLGVLALLLSMADGFGPVQILMSVCLVILAALWPMSRGPRHALAATLALIVTSGAIWAAWIIAGGGSTDATLYFLAIPIWMGSVLLRSSTAGLLGAVNVLATLGLLIQMIASGGDSAHLLPVPLLLAFASGLAVNSARLREQDFRRADELAAKLKEQERSRLQMLNTIAHDLASPLTPLKLQLMLVPKDKPLAPERMAIIERNVALMGRLVTDVKELARLDAGAMRMDLKPNDLAEIARGAVDAFREDAAAREIALEADLRGPLPVAADAERITQVVYNLMTNALKFTPPGGRVVLRAVRENGRATLSVRDSGRGLTPDEMSRLFKPFSQVHERSEVKERGTGLGLYISQGIAHAHGGEVRVESEGRGCGSTFVLGIPSTPTPSP